MAVGANGTAVEAKETATSVPQTATTVPPSATSVPQTATSVPPSATSVSPTATSTPPTANTILATKTRPLPSTNSVFPTATRALPITMRVLPLTPRSISDAPAHPRLANTPRVRHKARVKDGHTTQGESSFGKKLWCVLIVVFLGGIGWQMWKLHLYNNAVREAKEAGFRWECEDTISLIRQDWHNAFKKETWGKHPRVLGMGKVPDLGRYREMLHQLRPTDLYVYGCKDENVDALKGLTALRTLSLYDCTALQNVDALKGLTALQWLDLGGCLSLQNVDGLKGLTALQMLNLYGCDKIPPAALRELRAALPNTEIIFPDGTLNPPQ